MRVQIRLLRDCPEGHEITESRSPEMRSPHLARRIATSLFGALRNIQIGRPTKRLKIRENIALGEKRFLAIVQVDEKEFLVGGSNTTISMLGQMSDSPSFAETFRQQLNKEDPS